MTAGRNSAARAADARPRRAGVPRSCARATTAGASSAPSRFACIQDAADYFRLARQAMLQARDTIFSVGWDISATLDLAAWRRVRRRADPARRAAALARASPAAAALLRPHLGLRGPLHARAGSAVTRWRLGWRMPRRVHFGFDDHHPFGASHHQKIIVVDDALAFCGGVDLTGHRWDTAAHRLDEPHRLNADGTPYGPYHEIQAMADGPVAAALGALVRDRWDAMGERTRPLASPAAHDLWPDGRHARSDGRRRGHRTDDAAVGTERGDSRVRAVVPRLDRRGGTLDLHREPVLHEPHARRAPSPSACEEPDGPEVIVVMPKECEGWIEKQTMGVLRHEALEMLVGGRPASPAAPRLSGGVAGAGRRHVRAFQGDDRRRSPAPHRLRRTSRTGRWASIRNAISSPMPAPIRCAARACSAPAIACWESSSACAPEVVAAEIARLGSLGALIDARADADRTLLPVDMTPPEERTAGGGEGRGGSRRTSRPRRRDDRRASAARRTRRSQRDPSAPGCLRHHRGAPGCRTSADWNAAASTARSRPPASRRCSCIALAVVVVAHLALVPLELLAVLAGVAFGSTVGGGVAPRWRVDRRRRRLRRRARPGPGKLMSWMSRRAYRSTRQLGAHGVVGVAVLRLMSIASALSVHLVCGATRVPVGAYLLGSAAGLAPPMFVLAGVGSLLRTAFRDPSWVNGLTAAAGVVGACALAFAVRALLVARQFSPTRAAPSRTGGVRLMRAAGASLRVATYNVHALYRHRPAPRSGSRRLGRRRTGRGHRGAAGVHVCRQRRDRDPGARRARRPGRLRVRAGADASNRHAVLRQRPADASSDRRGPSPRSVDRRTRAARRPRRDRRRRRHARAPAGDASRPARARAPLPGAADAVVSRIGPALARRRARRHQRLAAAAGPSCTSSIAGWAPRRGCARFPRHARCCRWTGSGSIRPRRCGDRRTGARWRAARPTTSRSSRTSTSLEPKPPASRCTATLRQRRRWWSGPKDRGDDDTPRPPSMLRIVCARRRADHRQRQLRNHRHVPLPRLHGVRRHPAVVDRDRAAAAGARLRRARRLRRAAASDGAAPCSAPTSIRSPT